jgi:hypothetical protein
MSDKETPKRKRVTGLEVHEISLVDRPAVPGAKYIIMKRAKGNAEAIQKGAEQKIPIEVIEKICPPCAAKMREKGFKAIVAKQMPPQMLEGLCDSYGAEEGFRTRCMENISGVDDPGAFCNWLENECHGTFESRAKCEKCGRAKAFYDDEECPEDMYGRHRMNYAGPRAGEDPIDYLQRSVGLLVALRHAYPESVRASILQLDDLIVTEAKKKREEPPKGQEGERDNPKEGEEKKADDAGAKPGECPEGMTWDPKEAKCMPAAAEKKAAEECPEGQMWDPGRSMCVPKPEGEMAKVADGAVQLTPEQEARVDALIASFNPAPASK